MAWEKLISSLHCLLFVSVTPDSMAWSSYATSRQYYNTKLVTETGNPFPLLKIDRNSPSSSSITCNAFCNSNASCLGFNLYPTEAYYVCEFLVENFCSNRQRIALQAWSGGIVWDKLVPGMTKACIEQKFDSTTTTNYCNIGRYGCQTNWPNCDTCIKTCQDCKKNYSGTSGPYNCTLWPEGHFQAPIFGFCDSTATFVVQRNVDEYSGRDLFRYVMPLFDMYRLSKLQSYKSIIFNFKATDGTKYSSTYINFTIDLSGSLMNMMYKTGNGLDGFQLGGKPLKPSPFVFAPDLGGNCGSFWFLNSTQSSAILSCPGGAIGMFGDVNFSSLYQITTYGISWPKARTDGKVLIYADIKFDV